MTDQERAEGEKRLNDTTLPILIIAGMVAAMIITNASLATRQLAGPIATLFGAVLLVTFRYSWLLVFAELVIFVGGLWMWMSTRGMQ